MIEALTIGGARCLEDQVRRLGGLHIGSKDQYEVDPRNHSLQDACVYVALEAAIRGVRLCDASRFNLP